MITEVRSRAGNPFRRIRETQIIAQAHPNFAPKGLRAKFKTFRRGGQDILDRHEQWFANWKQEMRTNHRIEISDSIIGILSRSQNRDTIKTNLEEILAKNPHIVDHLQEAQDAHPLETSMAVIFNWRQPIVIALDGDQLIGLLSSISCTISAMLKLSEDRPGNYHYEVFHSANGLIPALMQHIKEYPNAQFTYNERTMDPRDYIALAVQGYLGQNEFRRVILKEGR